MRILLVHRSDKTNGGKSHLPDRISKLFFLKRKLDIKIRTKDSFLQCVTQSYKNIHIQIQR